MLDLAAIAGKAIAILHQHQPWLADKVGAAAITQTVKELWEKVKGKLGNDATQKAVEKPDDDAQWAILQARLLLALDSDKEFADKVHDLVTKGESEDGGGISQNATGIGNKQAAVKGSTGVNILQH
jgi:hypothetical protein